jgi:uncharacterized protein YggE
MKTGKGGTNAMKRLSFILTLLLLIVLTTGCSAQPSLENISTINAAGTGKITTQPDTVEVRLSVITEGKDKGVQETTAVKTQKVINALLALGLTKEEMETRNVSLQPIYNWNNNKGNQIVGYRAENSIVVRSKQIEIAGRITDTAVKNGAEMIGSLNFSLSDEGKEKLLEQAMEKAVTDAKKQAESAARAAGVKIVGIKRIDIQKGVSTPPILYDTLRKAAAPAPETPVIPGDTEYTVTVQASFEIK